ncbi:MAG: tRNA (adenosine(37)-N6)-dimethylallyltransferase MiaA [Puniceicoccales bacterium]
MKRPLPILTGTTASGKSSIAIDWARKTGGAILSCDALLFYRGADIGTAKPSRAERDEIPHYGIDLSDPSEVYDLPRYIDHALEVLEDAAKRDIPVLVAGGSGFYAAAFHEPPPDPIEIPEEIRQKVRDLESQGGTEALREALLAHDPHPDIDLLNPRRIAPALERCLTTGLTTKELRDRHRAIPCPFEKWERSWYQVDREPEALESRIQLRTRQMLDEGLVDEVRTLRARGMEKNPTLASAIGYRETLAYLDGHLAESDLASAISANTKRLAARQRRWFRNRMPEAHLVQSASEIL